MSYTDDYPTIVQQQVVDAVITNWRERVMQPTYGCDVANILFDPSNAVMRSDVASQIFQKLTILCPRAKVAGVTLTLDDNATNLIKINVTFSSQFIDHSLAITVPVTQATSSDSVVSDGSI